MHILQTIGAAFLTGAALLTSAIFGITESPAPDPTQHEALGADTISFFGGQSYVLAGTGISSSATFFTLTSFTLTQNGHPIQDTEMADTFYLTFEPGSRARQEFASCTTVTQNADGSATISGCTRGLSPITPYTASTSLQFAHAGGSYIIFSNSPQFYDQFTAKGNDETITGDWQVPTPSSANSIANKAYVLSAISGTSTLAFDRITVAGIAGETFATGSIVYAKPSDQRWYLADNDDTSTYVDRTLGIAQGPGSSGVNINGGILVYGLDSTQVGLTAGAFYFLSSTAGATTTSTTSQAIGRAKSTTQLFFDQNIVDSSVYVPTTFTSTTTFSGTQIFTSTSTFTGRTVGFGTASVTVFTTTGSSTFTVNPASKYIIVEGVGGGAESSGTHSGGGGGYFRKLILTSALSATTAVYVGSSGFPAGNTLFGGVATGTGGGIGTRQTGGSGSGGDININGGNGINSGSGGTGGNYGVGGQAFLGNSSDDAPAGYGAGAAGSNNGGIVSGRPGIIIVTEYF